MFFGKGVTFIMSTRKKPWKTNVKGRNVLVLRFQRANEGRRHHHDNRIVRRCPPSKS